MLTAGRFIEDDELHAWRQIGEGIIDILAADIAQRGLVTVGTLPLPSPQSVYGTFARGPFRIVCQFVAFPYDGSNPGYRVDVHTLVADAANCLCQSGYDGVLEIPIGVTIACPVHPQRSFTRGPAGMCS